MFMKIFDNIKDYIQKFYNYVLVQDVPNPDNNFWDKVIEVVKTIFKFTIGGVVIYFFKEIQNFLLGSFIKIGNLLFIIVLKILDIILFLSKLFYFIFKNVIIMLSFVFFNL
ncbi:MAG: hypothetical protein ACQBVK_04740 [Candidatus Phytoplasma sp. TWB_XP]